jgi:signal transduction histidine kinase
MLIQVVDGGCGIAGDLETIFQPFYTTKEDGIGLGLAVARRIVSQHGGALTAQRNASCGVTFSVRLPLRATARTEAVYAKSVSMGT